MKLDACRKRLESGSRTLRHACFIFPFVFVLYGASRAATLYVNPSHPQAQDRGPGDESQPYRTISHALENLRGGDRLVIMQGVYRETVDLKQARLSGDGKRTIIEGAPGAKVVIKGSDVVTGWEPHSNGVFVKRNWPHNSQQVFVDGVAMKQIGGTISSAFTAPNVNFWPGRVAGNQNSLVPGSFHYDEVAKNLFLKPADGSLNGKLIEVSVRPLVIQGTGLSNVTLRNLSAMHSNTSAHGRSGAIYLVGNKLALDGVTAIFMDALAINVQGDDNMIKNSVASYNGQMGMSARGRNNWIINNATSCNNTRGFNDFWEAGGNKFVFMEDSVLSGHKSFFNQGDGIWFDIENHRNRIENCVSAYNKGEGIHYEISSSAHIKNNQVFGNGRHGIYISNSRNSIVEHNLVARNRLDGIAVNNEPGRAAKFPPNYNRVINNIVAWNGKLALRLPSASFSNMADANLFVGEDTPSYGIWEAPRYPAVTGLSEWQAKYGQDKNSWQKVAPIPLKVAAKLKNRETDLDWDLLNSLASQVKAANARKGPGPE